MKKLLTCALAVLLFSSVARSQEADTNPPDVGKHSVGVGIGIPYGILGANVDVNVTPNFYISGGIGSTVIADVGYSIGLRYSFLGLTNALRPRVSAFYGVNAATELTTVILGPGGGSSTTESTTYSGLTAGAGAQWMWGESKTWGLDFDVLFIVTSGLDVDDLRDKGYSFEEPGTLKISIGFRYAF